MRKLMIGLLAAFALTGTAKAERLFELKPGTENPHYVYLTTIRAAEVICKLDVPDHDLANEILGAMAELKIKTIRDMAASVDLATALLAMGLRDANKTKLFCGNLNLLLRGF